MGRIKSVSIKNFISLREIEVQTSESVTLISGNNNSGKSTFLEALFLFYDRNNPLMPIRDISFRNIPNFSGESRQSFSHLFTNNDTSRTVEIVVNDGQRKSMQLKLANVVNDITLLNKISSFEGTKSDDNLVSFQSPKQLSLKFIINSSIVTESSFTAQGNQISLNIQRSSNNEETRVMFVPSRGGMSTADEAQRFSEISLNNEEHKFISLLKVFDPNLESIRIQTNASGPYLSSISSNGIESPIGMYGGGMRKLLEILLAISFARNGFVLIDEIENGFHYSRFPDVWKMIYEFSKAYRCQIFAVTHSYECLESAIEMASATNSKPVVVKFLREGNSTLAKYYDYDLAKYAIHETMELR